MNVSKWTLSAGIVLTAGLTAAQAADWPQWGGGSARNMVSGEKNIPSDFTPGKLKEGSTTIDMSTTKNVKWVAKMGSQTYGNPTVAGGRVYVGTNNDGRNDPRFKGDYSLLECLDEKTGKVNWIFTVPKLGAGKVNDWEYLGITSSPTVEGDRVYLVTNRCDVVCLDANGLKNGNQGNQKEAEYMAGVSDNAAAKPVQVNPEVDADILWVYDMRQELNSFPHNATSSAPLIVGDLLFVSTSNGVDWSHISIPSPKTPSLIALKKDTEDPNGELAGEETSQIGTRILHGGWSSPSYVKELNQVVYTGPDGYIYGFDATPAKDKEGPVLKEIWRFDANPIKYRYKQNKDGSFAKDANGKLVSIKYPRPDGPSEFIATPVIVEGKLYAAIGQDPEHGEGMGHIMCLDIAKMQGDCSPMIVDNGEIKKNPNAKGVLWESENINRAISTCAVANGLCFAADFSGFVYCFDAATGELQWRFDTMSHIWGSPLVVDGKVFIGNEDGDLNIFAADRGKPRSKPGKTEEGKNEANKINTVNFGDAIYSSPVAANGTLYVATATQLYAISEGGK